MQEQYLIIKKLADHGGSLKTPTHALYCKDGKEGKDYMVAKFWTRDGQYGKFLSGVMLNDYTNKEGVNMAGFRILKNKTVGQEIQKQEPSTGGINDFDF